MTTGISPADDIDIPNSWKRLAERITAKKWRRILLVGSVDTGKSSFCRFLCRHMRDSGARVAVIDADIGQKDIGPPASITGAYVDSAVEFAQIKPLWFYFVGAVTPVRHLLPMVVGTQLLASIPRSDYTVVNTTGLVHGIGRILKSYKIEALRPDVIVALENESELQPLLKPYSNFRTFRISPSSRASTKTVEQRRALREKAFQGYFACNPEIRFPINHLFFQRSLLFSGKTVKDANMVHCERTPEGRLCVSESYEHPGDVIGTIPYGFERNLLCGVADRRHSGLGLALLKEIDFSAGTISLITPVAADRISTVQFGDLYISQTGHELDKRRPRYF